MTACQKNGKRLLAYVDGELSPGAARRVEDHLRTCAACREVWEGLRRVDGLVAGLPSLEASPGLTARLVFRAAFEPRRTAGGGWRGRLLGLAERFFEPFRPGEAARPGALETFSDFPPGFLSRAYWRLLERSV